MPIGNNAVRAVAHLLEHWLMQSLPLPLRRLRLPRDALVFGLTEAPATEDFILTPVIRAICDQTTVMFGEALQELCDTCEGQHVYFHWCSIVALYRHQHEHYDNGVRRVHASGNTPCQQSSGLEPMIENCAVFMSTEVGALASMRSAWCVNGRTTWTAATGS